MTMDSQDRHAIESLFSRLGDLDRNGAPRDPEADAFIRSQVEQKPGPPYYMAQTIVVQEQALNAAQARIDELEREGAARPAGGGGFLSGLFGGGQSAQPQRRRPSAVPASGYGQPASGQQPMAGPGFAGGRGRGGGFLAGAAQTAVGVAGGVVLGNMLGGMFAGDTAEAAETAVDDATQGAEDTYNEAEEDMGSFFDGGGDEEF